MDLRKEGAPKRFGGGRGRVFVLIMNLLGNKLGTNLLQLSISELRMWENNKLNMLG